jgi:Holliday junction resolvasome RuvABC endonuclease subunit
VSHPIVLGLDLSLTSSGIAHPDGTVEAYKPITAGSINYGLGRICEIRDYIRAIVLAQRNIELAVVESLAFDAHDKDRMQAQLAGLVRALLFDLEVPFLLVAPNTLKLYATGNGHADKYTVMRHADKRLGYEGSSPDEADALWLRAIGWDLLGVPIVDMPVTHTKALRALRDQSPLIKRNRP